MTEQRRIIYDIVMNACDHPTAEQIYMAAKQQKPNIAIGTVYRNLGILSENGDILHIPILNGPDRYDKTLTPHEHMLCICCGQVVDADIGDLTRHLAQQSGLNICSYELNLKGICPMCTQKAGGSEH